MRSETPYPNVARKLEMSLNASSRSQFVRNSAADQRLFGNTSPVGTYHRPVSPATVLVAGRVSVVAGA
jgi:hypothetical protein